MHRDMLKSLVYKSFYLADKDTTVVNKIACLQGFCIGVLIFGIPLQD